MSERSERLAASEASLAEKVVRSTTNQLFGILPFLQGKKRAKRAFKFLNKKFFYSFAI